MPPDACSEHADIDRLIAQAWHWRHDDTRRARGAAQRALALAEARGDARGRAWARLRLALCEHVLALDAGDDVPRLQACVAEMQALAEPRGEAEALNLLANILGSHDRHDDALALHLRCEALRRAAGDAVGVAASMNNPAIALCEAGRGDEAVALLQASLRLAEQQGDMHAAAYARVNLGATELARQAPAAALHHFEGGYTAAARTDDRALECTALTGLAQARALVGDTAGARDLLGHAQGLAQRTGNVRDAGRVSLAWGLVERADGQEAAARPHLQAALQQARHAGDRALQRRAEAALLAPGGAGPEGVCG